jgi:hypothetical protein
MGFRSSALMWSVPVAFLLGATDIGKMISATDASGSVGGKC